MSRKTETPKRKHIYIFLKLFLLFLILFCIPSRYGVCVRRMSWWNLRRTSNERQQRLICAEYLRAFSTTKNTSPGTRLQLVSVESYGKVHFIRCHRMRFVRWHDCLFPSSVWNFPTISIRSVRLNLISQSYMRGRALLRIVGIRQKISAEFRLMNQLHRSRTERRNRPVFTGEDKITRIYDRPAGSFTLSPPLMVSYGWTHGYLPG